MSLDLDTRQRAILQEMGIHVWWPAPVADEVLAPSKPVATRLHPQAAPIKPLSAPVRQQPEPHIQLHVTPNADPAEAAAAIEKVAANAIATGAIAQKALKIIPATPAAIAATGTPAVLADGIAAMDWAALTQTVANCQACQLCTARRVPVLGGTVPDMPRRADWLVVGEPVDDAEERGQTPFADQVGQLLDNMLKAVGVSRHAGADTDTDTETGADAVAQARLAVNCAYVTNVVKCRPAVVRNPSPQELAICEAYLRREVALVQPKVILALGRFAAQTLLQGNLPEGSKIPFGKLRGQLYRYQGIPVVVSYHPAYLLRNPLDKARAWADLCLALATVGSSRSG